MVVTNFSAVVAERNEVKMSTLAQHLDAVYAKTYFTILHEMERYGTLI